MPNKISKVMITGANRGLGLGFAKSYLQQGCEVFATARSLSSELKTLQQEFPKLHVISMDVSSYDSIKHGFETVAQKTHELDLLINNAGRMGHSDDHINDVFDEADAILMLKTNTLGPLWVAKQAVPLLQKGSAKKIVGISSGLGSVGDNQSGGYYTYRLSKAGLNMLNRNLAIDLKPLEITCVVICPGWVKTDMGGQEATLTVEQSVRSMTDTIDRLTLKDSGSYIQRNGETYPF